MASGNGDKRIVPRRYAPKTRTGCQTCRIRRVKCDEAKPLCRRCVDTGRRCDGYEAKALAAPAQCAREPALGLSLSSDLPCDALEMRTFDFFRSRTAPCVSGYFQDAVWSRIVLQVSHTEPTVRHAVNALGALHEVVCLKRISPSSDQAAIRVETAFPAREYAKALRGLQDLLQTKSVSLDLILICALLFIQFEALREAYVPALIHIENAVKLLQSVNSLKCQTIDPGVIRAIVGADLQATMYMGLRPPSLPYHNTMPSGPLPDKIATITEARDLVNVWTSRMFLFLRTTADNIKLREPSIAPIEAIAETQMLLQLFATLEKLLTDFGHGRSMKLLAREQLGIDVLRARVKCNRIVTATSLWAEEAMFDAHNDDFEAILTLCGYVIQNEAADWRLLSVTLDDGLLHPLSFTASRCREGHIRHRALALLEKLSSEPGIWHLEAITRIAQRAIELEEGGSHSRPISCTEIPEWRRIHSASLDSLQIRTPKNCIKVTFRTRPNGMDGEWDDVTEILRWPPYDGICDAGRARSETLKLPAFQPDACVVGIRDPLDSRHHAKSQQTSDGTDGAYSLLSVLPIRSTNREYVDNIFDDAVNPLVPPESFLEPRSRDLLKFGRGS